MKESIGQAFILNLILFFFGILVILFFGSINYSKAYKAKNRIITTIEKYGEWDTENKVRDEIYLRLQESGYQTVTIDPGDLRKKCLKKLNDNTLDDEDVVYPAIKDDANWNGRGFEFCVIRYCSGMGQYYQVVTFMRFEVPVVYNLLNPAIKGETKVLYKNINDNACTATGTVE